MKTLLLSLYFFSSSVVMAEYFPFNAVREWDNCTFWFYDDNIHDTVDKGIYQFAYGSSPYDKIYEKGIYDAKQKLDEYKTTTIFITIKESTNKEREGISFSCQFWLIRPNSPHDPAYLTNAKILTYGVATTDTILTNDVPTSTENKKIRWSDIKLLFLPK
jgi:hypothetical protein